MIKTEGSHDLLFNKILYTGILDDVWGLLVHPRRRLLFASKGLILLVLLLQITLASVGLDAYWKAEIPLRGEIPSG